MACACPGGKQGAQRCKADGSGFEDCQGCESGSGGHGGASGTTSTTSTGEGGFTGSGGQGVGGHGGRAQGGQGGSTGPLVCEPKTADCNNNPADGCETALDTLKNCGKCGVECSFKNADPVCSGGACTMDICKPGFADCNLDAADGCEVALDTDPANCGGCGATCGPGKSCSGGSCSCDGWMTDCAGACVDTTNDPANCGGCGKLCSQNCIGGACVSCDDGLAIDDALPFDAGKAIGLCAGLTKASWVLADGASPPADAAQLANFHLGHGILPDFGASNPPLEGKRVLALSSGTARRPADPGFVHRNFDKGYAGGAPVGFPKESPSCQGVTTHEPHDAAGLELEIQAPAYAQGFSFGFNFFTYEWPQYICTEFNDFFVANLSPFPKGQKDGNISFDISGNPISVNNGFLDVCGCPGNPPGKCTVPPDKPNKPFGCVLGTKGVAGTDFASDDSNAGFTNGSTGWLVTSAPVDNGQKIVLRFVTYDSSDGNVDSTTIIDNFQWLPGPVTLGTMRVISP